MRPILETVVCWQIIGQALGIPQYLGKIMAEIVRGVF